VFRLIDRLRESLQNREALKLLPPIAKLRSHACRVLPLAVLLVGIAGFVGCGGRKQTALNVPPAPELAPPEATSEPTPSVPMESVPGIHVDPNSRVLWSEVGHASWYGPKYNRKAAANGEIYNQDEMTAAHNTLPLNSIVRVVNLDNHHSTVVRITDRGPFVGDRIIDLSVAAAKAVDIYRPGTARVRVEVLETPRPIESGGRWCIQIGAFTTQTDALRVKEHLLQRYAGAQVIQFKGPTGYWVRLRMAQDDKEKTREAYEETTVSPSQVIVGGVFMVRLD
jgi:rare lipoprotein A